MQHTAGTSYSRVCSWLLRGPTSEVAGMGSSLRPSSGIRTFMSWSLAGGVHSLGPLRPKYTGLERKQQTTRGCPFLRAGVTDRGKTPVEFQKRSILPKMGSAASRCSIAGERAHSGARPSSALPAGPALAPGPPPSPDAPRSVPVADCATHHRSCRGRYGAAARSQDATRMTTARGHPVPPPRAV
jgi:hypothetical protein